MNVVLNIVLLIQILSALAMIGLILLQHGKGADMGAAFGSGSSGSLFGASGGANFLSRFTAVLAAIFFASTLGLAFFGQAHTARSGSVLEGVNVPVKAAPASNDISNQIPGTTQSSDAGASGSLSTVPTPSGSGGANKIPAK
jgi:preprotein translocase subunit SecG